MIPMRLNLWLAQPETEQKLAAWLRIAVIAFVCWAVAAVYGLWSTHAALVASQSFVVSQSKKITEVTQELPRKRTEAAKSAQVKVAATESAASADLTEELSRIAQVAGSEIAGVRIGDGDETAQGGGNAAKPAPASSAAAAAPASDGWGQESFECNVAGNYGALTTFLNVLAASRSVLDVTSVEVSQAGSKPTADGPHLEMKLSGILYMLPEKP
jgi:hypothetical protein